MPRDIPVGNGQLLITHDAKYRIRDLYFPYVGQENHAGFAPCRFGVWASLPDGDSSGKHRRKNRLFWTEDGWDIKPGYKSETLVTDVSLRHHDLKLHLRCNDAVDFNRPVMVRRIEIHNEHNEDREVRLFHSNKFCLYGTQIGDTAHYDPQMRALLHYRKSRYITCAFYMNGEQRIDEYATGTAGWAGAEGTYRDAEDGHLGGNPIAQGAVDSTMMVRVEVPANGTAVAHMVIGAAETWDEANEIHEFLHREGPQGAINRTEAYWKLWLAASRADFPDHEESGLSDKIEDIYKRSLLVVRTQIDNHGAIIAANDSDIMQFARDTYSYLWPRDGAFVADAMDAAGFPDLVRRFFQFSSEIIHEQGFFLHKYNPDGTPASSWHPWVQDDNPQLPIQEDETSLVIWALWRHFTRYRDIEFVQPMWVNLIRKAADFLVRYRDPTTKLPMPSYDLWEERWGVHTFTVATVYAGLQAAWQFAVCFGDTKRATMYANAAEEVRDAACKYLYSEEKGRFLRRIVPANKERNALLMNQIMLGRTPKSRHQALYEALPAHPHQKHVDAAHDWLSNVDMASELMADDYQVEFEEDDNVDASMAVMVQLGLLDVDDYRVRNTMDAIQNLLSVKTDVGGIARYQDDYYHQVSQDVERIPGNPWFICTLWMADYQIAKAKTNEELKEAAKIIQWVADRSLLSGCLAEQVHPETNEPLSVSPLTWSHATVVSTVLRYLNKMQGISPNDMAHREIKAIIEEAQQVAREPAAVK